jgi:hypothetical protein
MAQQKLIDGPLYIGGGAVPIVASDAFEQVSHFRFLNEQFTHDCHGISS